MKHIISYKLFESIQPYYFTKEELDEIRHYFIFLDDDNKIQTHLDMNDDFNKEILNLLHLQHDGKLSIPYKNPYIINCIGIQINAADKETIDELKLIINKLVKINDYVVLYHEGNRNLFLTIVHNTKENIDALEKFALTSKGKIYKN